MDMRNFSRLNQVLFYGLVGLISLLPLGCKTNSILVDSVPLSALSQATIDHLRDPAINQIYQDYFPENRFELSKRYKNRTTETRYFIEPRVIFKESISYEVFSGFEFKY
jgi:hypothetical protein